MCMWLTYTTPLQVTIRTQWWWCSQVLHGVPQRRIMNLDDVMNTKNRDINSHNSWCQNPSLCKPSENLLLISFLFLSSFFFSLTCSSYPLWFCRSWCGIPTFFAPVFISHPLSSIPRWNSAGEGSSWLHLGPENNALPR